MLGYLKILKDKKKKQKIIIRLTQNTYFYGPKIFNKSRRKIWLENLTYKFDFYISKSRIYSIKIMNPLLRVKKFLNQRVVKYGFPFLLVMLGGSFGLKEFAQLRYQFSRNSTITPAEMEKHGIKMKKPGEVTLETEYEKIKNLDIDNWEQVRGPRPWEENFEEKK